MEEIIRKLSFIDTTNPYQIRSMSRIMKIEAFLAGDIIVKEGGIGEKFYVIHSGGAQVIFEFRDYLYFDFQEVEKFIKKDRKH